MKKAAVFFNCMQNAFPEIHKYSEWFYDVRMLFFVVFDNMGDICEGISSVT